jgi:hypothetical protein
MPFSSGLLFTAIKTQAEGNFHVGAILLFYILKILLNKSVTLFQGTLFHNPKTPTRVSIVIVMDIRKLKVKYWDGLKLHQGYTKFL